MSKYTEHFEVQEIMAVVSDPTTNNATALSSAALARGAILIPAKGGDVYIRWLTEAQFVAEDTYAAATSAAHACVIHGAEKNVKIPKKITVDEVETLVFAVSFATDAEAAFTIPIQVVY